jgi:hypothetical protein
MASEFEEAAEAAQVLINDKIPEGGLRRRVALGKPGGIVDHDNGFILCSGKFISGCYC